MEMAINIQVNCIAFRSIIDSLQRAQFTNAKKKKQIFVETFCSTFGTIAKHDHDQACSSSCMCWSAIGEEVSK